MEESTPVLSETTSSKNEPAGGSKKDGGWRSKGRNWFSAKAPSVREGFKKITEKAPTVTDGLKKMTTKVEAIKINSPMKEGLKRFSTTAAPVKESLKKITAKAPSLQEGLMKGKVSFEKGLNSVSSFTQDETKLLMSMAKRKIYCNSEDLEDPVFTAMLNSVLSWKVMLESQKKCLERMITDQRAFEESQHEFASVLKSVPTTSSDYSKKSAELGSVLETQVQKLVPTASFEELAQQIEKILSSYVELQALKRKYTTAKNDVDVYATKLESRAGSEKLRTEFAKATQLHEDCKVEMTDLLTKIMGMKNDLLNPILLQVVGEDTSEKESLSCNNIR